MSGLLLALAALPLLGALQAAPGAPAEGRAVGQSFPDLELPTVDGARTLRVSDFRGRKLLLIEFASW